VDEDDEVDVPKLTSTVVRNYFLVLSDLVECLQPLRLCHVNLSSTGVPHSQILVGESSTGPRG
jgi:hypothetical protein